MNGGTNTAHRTPSAAISREKACCVMHERNGGYHEPCVHCQNAELRAEVARLTRRLATAEAYIPARDYEDYRGDADAA